jgi:hypothetical protein
MKDEIREKTFDLNQDQMDIICDALTYWLENPKHINLHMRSIAEDLLKDIER